MKKRMTATEAKNNFGGLLEAVATYGAVEIVRHGRPVAVVVSPRMLEEMETRPGKSKDETWGATHMIPAASAREAVVVRPPRGFDD